MKDSTVLGIGLAAVVAGGVVLYAVSRKAPQPPSAPGAPDISLSSLSFTYTT